MDSYSQPTCSVMRMTTTGNVVWENYVYYLTGPVHPNDRIDGLCGNQNNVYAFYTYINDLSVAAIIKMAYADGITQWIKKVMIEPPPFSSAGAVPTGQDTWNAFYDPYSTSVNFVSAHEPVYDSTAIPTYQYYGDTGTDFTAKYQVQLLPTWLNVPYHRVGNVVFEPNNQYMFVCGIASQSAWNDSPFIASIVKQTGVVSWSTFYLFGQGTYYASTRPIMSLNAFNQQLYLLLTYTYPANLQTKHLVWIMSNPTSASTAYLISTPSSTAAYSDFSAIETDDSTGNVILATTYSSGKHQVMLYSATMAHIKSFQSRDPLSSTFLQKRILFKSNNNMLYIAFNALGYSNGKYMGTIAKFPPSLEMSLYNCQYWVAVAGLTFSSLGTPTVANNQQFPANSFYTSNNLGVLDQTRLTIYQVQKYYKNQMILPYKDTYSQYPYSENARPCSVFQPPFSAELPTISLLQEDTVTFTLTPSLFGQCQKLPVTYTIFDEGKLAFPLSHAYMIATVSGNQLTITTTSSTPPGFRIMQIQAQVDSYGFDNIVPLPVIVWPSQMPVASNTATQTRAIACPLKSEWPKVFGTNNLGQNYLTSIDIDMANGNMFVGGISNVERPTHWKDKSTLIGLNYMFNNLGDMVWAYSFTNAMLSSNPATTPPLSIRATLVGADGFLYSLLLRDKKYGLVKQKYSSGELVWIRELNGTVHSQVSMIQDSTTKAIYIATARYDFGTTYSNPSATSYATHAVYKIDPTTQPPTQYYYTYSTLVYFYFNSAIMPADLPCDAVALHTTNDFFYTFQHISFASGGNGYFQPSLGKFSKTTGAALLQTRATMPAYSSSSVQPKFRSLKLIMSSSNQLYATFANYYPSTWQNVGHIMKVDSSTLAIIKQNHFVVTNSSTASISYSSSITLNQAETRVYLLIATVGYHLITYETSLLGVQGTTQMQMQSTSTLENMNSMKFYGGFIFVVSYGNNYISTGTYGNGLFERYSASFTYEDTCIGMQDAPGVSYSFADVTFSNDGLNFIKHYTIQTTGQYLIPFLYIYGEMISASQPTFQAQQAITASCPKIAPVFSPPLAHQQVTLNAAGTATATYSFASPLYCLSDTFLPTLSVDKQATLPAWIQVVWGTPNVITFDVTAANIGIKTIRVEFRSHQNQNIFVSDTFFLEVYPFVAYGISSTSPCSPSIIWPMHIGGSTLSLKFTYGDVDASASTFVMGGTMMSTTYLNGAASNNKAFFASFNHNWALNYMHTFDSHMAIETSLTSTKFVESGYVFLSVCFQKSPTQASCGSQNFYKFGSTNGKLANAKQFLSSKLLTISTVETYPSSGDIYLGGNHNSRGLSINYNSYDEAFIMKLNGLLEIKFFITFQLWKGGFSSTRGLIFDSTDSSLYAGVCAENPAYSYKNYGMVKYSSLNGNIQWSKAFYAPSQTLFVDGRVGITQDASNVYTCANTNDYGGPSSTAYELKISKSPKSGASSVVNLEIYTGQSIYSIDCDLAFSTYDNSLVIAVGSTSSQSTLQIFKVYSPFNSNYISNLYVSETNSWRSTLMSKYTNGYFYVFSRADYSTYYGIVNKVYVGQSTFAWPPSFTCSPITGSFSDYYVLTSLQPGINYLMQDKWGALTSYTHMSADVARIDYRNPEETQVFYQGTKPFMLTSYTSSCLPTVAPTAEAQSDRIGANGYIVGSGSQSFPIVPFKHCQNLEIKYSSYRQGQSTMPTPIITFNQLTNEYTVNPDQNSYLGTYVIVLVGTNVVNTQFATTSFRIEITPNTPPSIDSSELSTTSYQMYAWHSWLRDFKYGGDKEHDNQYWDATLYRADGTTPVTPVPTWFIYDNAISEAFLRVRFNKPPNAEAGTYIFKIKLWDYYNVLNPQIYSYTMKVDYNDAPLFLNPISQAFPSTRIPWPFNYTLSKSAFSDVAGDQISFSFDLAPTLIPASSTYWASQSYNPTTGILSIQGTPPYSNSYAGSYTFVLTVKDQFLTSRTYDFTLNISPAQPIAIMAPYDSSSTSEIYQTTVPFSVSVDLSGKYYDPQVQQIYSSVFINGTLVTSNTRGTCPQPLFPDGSYCLNSTSIPSTFYSPWVFWDPSTSIFRVEPKHNIYTGNHKVVIQFTDNLAAPSSISFIVSIAKNWPLVVIRDIPVKRVIVGNNFTFEFNKSEIFRDPMNRAYTQYARMPQSDYLPNFIAYNTTSGDILTLRGIATSENTGSFSLEIVGVNFAGWITTAEFSVTVLPCYFKCQGCWDNNYNTCKYCNPGYFLYTTECVDECVVGTYPFNANLTCLTCPQACKSCTGPDSLSQCPQCSTGYFYLNNGCYAQCPNGYWSDTSTYTCQKCHEFCSICYGPTKAQCSNCSELVQPNQFGILTKVGYLLSGTECKIPRCPDGQFFEWYPYLVGGKASGNCLPCNPRCKTCVNQADTACLTCYPGYKMQSNHYCKRCDEIFGFFTNDQMDCQEICGDGILAGQTQCDDNNTISGDGCSSKCQIEFGFGCITNSTNPQNPKFRGPSVCKPNVKPKLSITSVSADKTVYLKFSSIINIKHADAISPKNMIVNITGPLDSYIFTWRIPKQQPSPLIVNRNITKFIIILEDFQQSIKGEGTEQVVVSFKNYELIQDIYENDLIDRPAIGDMSPFVYISPQAAAAIASGGQSLKYTFLSVFSFNLIIKVLLKSSMGYLWSLVHALQIFNYLLLINIKFPSNLDAFTNYLSVATGNVPEFAAYIPDLSSYIINIGDIQEDADDDKIPANFRANDLQPYMIVAYGKTFTLYAVAAFVILPSLYILNKLCKKVKLWEELINGFFFNTPMRSFVETYIDATIQILLNTRVIKFGNFSQILSTLVAFGGLVVALLMPFVVMNLISKYRKKVRQRAWVSSFGMLTEEVRTNDILQLFYYPAFMFQRLVIAAIIVFGGDYPALQCYGVIFCNLAMIYYLITIKPFRVENQQITTVVDEIIIMLCVLLFLIIVYNPNLTENNKNSLGWVIIFTICFSVIKNFSIVIFFSLQKLKVQIKNLFGNEEDEVDSDISGESDCDSDSLDSINSEEVMDPNMRPDAELIREIKRERMMLRKGEKLKKGPTTAASKVPNPFPSMIYTQNLSQTDTTIKKDN